jgi:NitT/TauT family transport system substrate-binding protein
MPATFAAGKNLERTNINLNLIPAMHTLPAWVALEKGFYKGEGLNEVKHLRFRGEAPILQAMIAGTADVSISNIGAIIDLIKRGQKFKAVWNGYNQAFFDWYAKPKYKSIADTKGARYAVTKYGALTHDLTNYVIRKAGLDPTKDIKVLQLGGSRQSLAAMEAGQLDVSIMAPPASYMAEEKGFVKLISQRKMIGPDWPLNCVWTSEKYIAKNPNTLKALLRALSKSIMWIKANPEEAAEVASKSYKYKLTYCRRFIDDWGRDWHADGRLPTEKGWNALWDIYVEIGKVKEKWSNSKWLDETFLKTQDQWLK